RVEIGGPHLEWARRVQRIAIPVVNYFKQKLQVAFDRTRATQSEQLKIPLRHRGNTSLEGFSYLHASAILEQDNHVAGTEDTSMIEYVAEIMSRITREEYERHFEAPIATQKATSPVQTSMQTGLVRHAGHLLYSVGTRLAALGKRIAREP